MDAFEEIISATVEHKKVTQQLQSKLSEHEERLKNIEEFVAQKGSEVLTLSAEQRERLKSVGLLKEEGN